MLPSRGRARRRRGTVIVVHENRGLNEHTRDVARRLALAGFRAVAPDFLSPSGGTPPNEDAAREAIGKLDLGAATAAGVAMLDELARAQRRQARSGVVGFCWGGAYVNRLAVAAGDKLECRRGLLRHRARPGRSGAGHRRRCSSTSPGWTRASTKPLSRGSRALRAAGKRVTFQL